MGSHPLNLAIRFLLELAALTSFGLWGWKLSTTHWRFVLVLVIPLLLAVAWGIFNVPGDPSRSGNAPVIVPGFVRLALELIFFGLATLALYKMNYPWIGGIMGVTVILHYLISYDRIIWLLGH